MASRTVIGVDIGQKQDPTAIAVAETDRREISPERSVVHFVIRYLNRVGLAARDPFDCPAAAQFRRR